MIVRPDCDFFVKNTVFQPIIAIKSQKIKINYF